MHLVPAAATHNLPAVPERLIAKAIDYAKASRSEATLETYAKAWKQFVAWCGPLGLPHLPASPETVVGYIADRGDDLRPVTLKKHLAAIAVAHRTAGLQSPTSSEAVKMTMAGLRRTKGTAPKAKRALRVSHVRQIVGGLGGAHVDVRDRALLLLGFITGMRRSEVVGLDVDDIAFEPEGIVVTIRKSKRDQEGRGRQVPVLRGKHEETCPVRALRAWLTVLCRDTGSLFIRLDRAGSGERLSGKAVALIVKRRAEQAGLDPVMFSGHSLRRGFCTSAAKAGASEADIARTTGHQSVKILRGYVEAGRLFENAAARHLDL